MRPFFTYLKPAFDFTVTSLHWIYLIFGFVAFFSPFYLGALIFSQNRESAFQKLDHLFFKSFFFLSGLLIPKLVFKISDEVLSIRSSVIVCNHLSYFDPLIFVSLFEKHKTNVKSTFFKVPVFGSILKTSGYIPSTSVGVLSSLMIERVEGMSEFLISGGNLSYSGFQERFESELELVLPQLGSIPKPVTPLSAVKSDLIKLQAVEISKKKEDTCPNCGAFVDLSDGKSLCPS